MHGADFGVSARLTCFEEVHVTGQRRTDFSDSLAPHQRKQPRLGLIFTKTHTDLQMTPPKKLILNWITYMVDILSIAIEFITKQITSVLSTLDQCCLTFVFYSKPRFFFKGPMTFPVLCDLQNKDLKKNIQNVYLIKTF